MVRRSMHWYQCITVMVHNSFPLPHIEEALQVVKAAMWFTLFNLAQGYLQLAMDEADIHKTAFQAGSSGLYEFTRMPFGSLMLEQVLLPHGNVSWGPAITDLLFYLDNVCIFSSSINEVLDRIDMVLKCLQDFNLKIKPKKSYFFQTSMLFLGHMLSKDGISPNPKKITKVKDWPVLQSAKEVHSFLGLASYYRWFIPQFAKWANPLHDLICPVATKKKCVGVKLPPLLQKLPPFEWTPVHQSIIQKFKTGINIFSSFSLPGLFQTIHPWNRHISKGVRWCFIARGWRQQFVYHLICELYAQTLWVFYAKLQHSQVGVAGTSMKSSPTCAKCMVFISLQWCHTIHVAMHSVNGLIALYLD